MPPEGVVGGDAEGRAAHVAPRVRADEHERPCDRHPVAVGVDLEDVREPGELETDERPSLLRRLRRKGDQRPLRTSGAADEQHAPTALLERPPEPLVEPGVLERVVTPGRPMLEQKPAVGAFRSACERDPRGRRERAAAHRPPPRLCVTAVTPTVSRPSTTPTSPARSVA